MTKNEFMTKYGNTQVKFLRYHKYRFTFLGTAEDGNKILVMTGGDAHGIYQFEVCSDDELSVHELDPFAGKVVDAGHNIVDGFEV